MSAWIIGLLLSGVLANPGEAAVTPAGQSYDLGEFGSVFFGEGPNAGDAVLRQDLLFCTAEVRLEWRVDGDQLELTLSRNACAEEDARLNDAFSDDCPDGWPDLQVGDSQTVCWFTPGPVTRTQ
jgi:hypothetical protein